MAQRHIPVGAMLLAAMSGVVTFVPLRSGPSLRVPDRAAPLQQGAVSSARFAPVQPEPRRFGVAAAAAALLLAAAGSTPRKRISTPNFVAQLPASTWASATPTSATQRGLVACKSLYSCYKIYFRNGKDYRERARKVIRNRAYNIYMRNYYKKAMKKVLRYAVLLEFGDLKPDSLEAMLEEIREKLDDACLKVDEACVQGILKQNVAYRRKDRMCRALLRGSIVKGLVEKPEDPFQPAHVTIGYEMPQYTKEREPRPWQLPGWKSPWMLKREFDAWMEQREKLREEMNAAA